MIDKYILSKSFSFFYLSKYINYFIWEVYYPYICHIFYSNEELSPVTSGRAVGKECFCFHSPLFFGQFP